MTKTYQNKFTKQTDELKEDYHNNGGKLSKSIINRALDLWNMFFKQDDYDKAISEESFLDVKSILKDQSDKLKR